MIEPKQTGLLTALCIFLSFSAAAATDNPCALLTQADRSQANEILNSQYCYNCCDLTIAECLKQEPRCRLATRLRDFIYRLLGTGMTSQKIERALLDRGLSMIETPVRAAIDPKTGSRVGKAGALVEAVLYTCVRCPFCSKLFPPLYDAVVEGALKGKVALLVKVFPIKGHPYSVEAGLAAVAAWKQGKMSEFFLDAYKHFDGFTPKHLPSWAEKIGLDMAEYRQAVGDATTRDILVAVKREGYRNKVHATPTLFINGRKYQGPMDDQTLIDVMEEEYDRMRGDMYE